jgi:imidazolonepropionase
LLDCSYCEYRIRSSSLEIYFLSLTADPTVVVTPNQNGTHLEIHKDCEITITNGKIVSYDKIPSSSSPSSSVTVLDAQQTMITPGFIDAHTHLFPPIDRANEFALRSIKSYKEIAASGGGILSTVRSFRQASLDEILEANIPLMEQFFAQGTTTVEIKSGYGLTTKDEIKSLEVIQQLQLLYQQKLTIYSTFMGAHAIPREYSGKVDEYVELICSEMLPKISQLHLADFCDVFCEKGYFDHQHTTKILQTAQEVGLKVRIHADEFVDSHGAITAARMNCYSADHLMAVTQEGIEAMAEKGVIPIVLPGATVFLGKGHGYAPMRKILDGGCRLAVATDHNPGSSVHQSMPQMMQLSMANGGITLEEAFLAATYNPAISLAATGRLGTLQVSTSPRSLF